MDANRLAELVVSERTVPLELTFVELDLIARTLDAATYTQVETARRVVGIADKLIAVRDVFLRPAPLTPEVEDVVVGFTGGLGATDEEFEEFARVRAAAPDARECGCGSGLPPGACHAWAPGATAPKCCCARCAKYDGCPNLAQNADGFCLDCAAGGPHKGFDGGSPATDPTRPSPVRY